MGILDRRTQHVRCFLARVFISDSVSPLRLFLVRIAPHLERRSCTMRSSADDNGTGCCGIAMVTPPKSRGSLGSEGVLFHEKEGGREK